MIVSNQLLVDLLGVAGSLMFADQGLASVGLEGADKDGVHVLLYLDHQVTVVRGDRDIRVIKDMGATLGLSMGTGDAMPVVPPSIIFQDREHRGVSLH